jgi:small subunit ribosomal protein S21
LCLPRDECATTCEYLVREGGDCEMKVELRDSEGFEGLLRRFTKEMQKSGKLREYRSKRRFVSKSEQRRAKIRKAEHKRRRKEASTTPR